MQKILFIGNSFTFFNDMPNSIFAPLCKASGLDVEVCQVTVGGHSLIEYAKGDSDMDVKARELLLSGEFSAAVLQDQSNMPVSDFPRSMRGATLLAELAKRSNTPVYLYQTWGYKDGKHGIERFGGTTEAMAHGLKAAYTKIGCEIGARLCPVGDAMLDVYKQNVTELYDPDGYHPSRDGSTIAALVIFESIFGFSPTLTPDIKKELAAASHKALANV